MAAGAELAAFGLKPMRVRYLSVLFLVSALSTLAADAKPKPALTFSLTATNESFVVLPEPGFRLEVFGNSSDWSVDVSRGSQRGWLLYPRENWHGAHESDLSAWAHAERFYPDERVIRVRGYQRWVRVLLVDAEVGGEKGSQRFIGGRVEVYWQRTPNLKGGVERLSR